MDKITIHYQKNLYGKGTRKPAQWVVSTGDPATDVVFVLEPRVKRAKANAFQAARAHAATLGATELRRLDRYTFTSEPAPAKTTGPEVPSALLAQGLQAVQQPRPVLHRASHSTANGAKAKKNGHRTKKNGGSNGPRKA